MYKSEAAEGKRKALTTAALDKLYEALFKVFNRQGSQRIPLSRSIMSERIAVQINQKLNGVTILKQVSVGAIGSRRRMVLDNYK